MLLRQASGRLYPAIATINSPLQTDYYAISGCLPTLIRYLLKLQTKPQTFGRASTDSAKAHALLNPIGNRLFIRRQ
jgi:hypothetical protein